MQKQRAKKKIVQKQNKSPQKEALSPKEMAAVRVVTYNAHYGKMSVPITTRHEMCARMLLAQRLATSTIFMIQEASLTLYNLLKRAKTHTAYYDPRGALMAVLTLVPKTLEALEATEACPKGVMVRIVPFETSPMRRQFHAVFLCNSRLALVNTHMESCTDGARARKDQLGEIGRAIKREGEYRFGVFGDLNWPIKTRESTTRWLTHIPNTLHEVKQISAKRDPAISLHTLNTFTVE